MGTTRIAFMDTETTSLRHDRRAWEIGLIVRTITEVPEEQMIGQHDSEHSWLIQATDLDLGNADVQSLKIGKFYDRHPHARGTTGLTYGEAAALCRVEQLTRGATIVGAVPNFDTEVLGNRMRAHGLCPSWHYHLVDVENLAAGAMKMAPPWKFDTFLEAYGLKYDEADRHTALGDARMARDLYDAVMKKVEPDAAIVGRLIEANR